MNDNAGNAAFNFEEEEESVGSHDDDYYDGDDDEEEPAGGDEEIEVLDEVEDDDEDKDEDSNNNDEEEKEDEEPVPECKSHFNGTLTTDCPTRNVYKIATLNASPQKCLHIEPLKVTPPEEQIIKCVDQPNWFDGTNGCAAYERNKRDDWCNKYGRMRYPTSRLTAMQACCTCGGGSKKALRFQPGDDVTVADIERKYGCKKLKITMVHPDAQNYDYTIEAVEGCQPMGRSYKNGKLVNRYRVDPGTEFAGKDSPGIKRDIHIELRKCSRKGVTPPEQEFILDEHQSLHLSELHSNNHSAVIDITHKLTGMTLSYENKNGSPLIIQRSFGDEEVFDNSAQYFYIYDGTKHLISGRFGSAEYNEAKWLWDERKDSQETQFSMWTFQPVNMMGEGASSASTSTDEHADWLLEMTQQIGIEYVEKNFAPWHILDVDRGASKSAVKLRFRELSRHFHPDKNKSEEAAKIFVSLQGAYEGLKNSNEKEKQEYMAAADSESQLFSHSRHVKELLPFHWRKVESRDGMNVRYVIDLSASMNNNNNTNENENEIEKATDSDQPSDGEKEAEMEGHEDEKSKEGLQVQLWLLQLYSARCGMSRAVDGFLDIAAQHLEKYENIKVAAYGCGLYDTDLTKKDLLGVTTDPICKQFDRSETPNIHIVVETLSGNEGVNMMALEANAKFDYFYAAVPTGNSTQLHPGAIIDYAINGKKVWENFHLVKEMVRSDFTDPAFMTNTSVVAFVDKNDKDTKEVQDALTTSLPALAGRFKGIDLFVGVAACGSGDEDDDHYIDCSALNVSWLPDVKIFGPDQSEGLSLVRDEFMDRRDVQIAIESLTNTLAAMHGLSDEDRAEDQFEDQKEEQEDGGDDFPSDCTKPMDFDFSEDDIDLDQLDKPEDTAKLDAPDEAKVDEKDEDQDQLDAPEDKPKLEDGSDEKLKLEAEDRPKLATGSNKPKLASREERTRATGRIDARRKTGPRGGGAILGGSAGGGSVGAIGH